MTTVAVTFYWRREIITDKKINRNKAYKTLTQKRKNVYDRNVATKQKQPTTKVKGKKKVKLSPCLTKHNSNEGILGEWKYSSTHS
jgi:hypothetical protein